MNALDDSLDRVADFLHRSRDRDGLWYDFRTLAGDSSEWVTAFVARALAEIDPRDGVLVPTLDALIARQRRTGGWGYGAAVPPDCDSTAWALLALSTVRTRPSPLRRGARFILAHQQAAGGFSTWSAGGGIDAYIGVPGDDAVRGWLGEHVCVSGVAMQALLECGARADHPAIARGVGFLAAAQGGDGGWTSFWWTGTAYATYHSLKALAMAGARGDAEDAACDHLRARQGADGGWAGDGAGDGDAFETAFAVLALLHAGDDRALAAARRGVTWLLARQLRDGSWASVPIMRIPPPRAREASQVTGWRTDRLGAFAVLADQRRTFTSAAAARALAVARGMLGDA